MGLPGGLRDRRWSAEARAVSQFAAAGAIAMLLVGALLAFAIQRRSIDEAVSDARQMTELTAHGIVQPALNDGVTAGDPGALATLDSIVRSRVLGRAVVRVKIWAPDGTIVYSDEPRLVGRRFALGTDEQDALASGRIYADVSDLRLPENQFEPRDRQLLEVYLPVKTSAGHKLLYENYLRFDAVTASGNQLLLMFMPAFAIGLLALEIVQLPLAWSLARRVSEGRKDRERLLQRALEASDRERRLIARDLHDGAVQNLTGVALQLTVQAHGLQESGQRETATTVETAAARARSAVGELRQLLVQIYPPDVGRTGLGPALGDLLSPLADKCVSTEVAVPHDLRLRPETETLIYRAAQEAIRNAAIHSGATTVRVSVATEDGRAILRVQDDGRGIDPGLMADRQSEGHLGLRLLADLARDAGGELRLLETRGGGATVELEAPA